VPAVDADVAPIIAIVVGLVVVGVLEKGGIAPGITEIILRAGAEGGRELLAVTKNFSSPSPHHPPRGFQTCSITPTKRPGPSAFTMGQSIARSGSMGSSASRCHLAWNRANRSIGRESGASVTSKVTVRLVLPSLTSSSSALFANGMYQQQYHHSSPVWPSGSER